MLHYSLAGETVFYNSNILHCATYRSQSRRATLHGCMGDPKGGASRARNILQHELDWMKGEDFFQILPSLNARRMLDKLIAMSDSSGQDGTIREYSLQNWKVGKDCCCAVAVCTFANPMTFKQSGTLPYFSNYRARLFKIRTKVKTLQPFFFDKSWTSHVPGSINGNWRTHVQIILYGPLNMMEKAWAY